MGLDPLISDELERRLAAMARHASHDDWLEAIATLAVLGFSTPTDCFEGLVRSIPHDRVGEYVGLLEITDQELFALELITSWVGREN